MSNKLISIIVPAHNVERYIDKCLTSLALQTYKNLEIIVIDDNSPDESGKIADKWAERDNRFKVIHNQKNMGHSTVRNIGLDVAKGDYIGFVDPDDYVDHRMFDRLLELLINNDADISLCLEKAFDDGKAEPDFSNKEDIIVRVEEHEEYIEHFMDPFTGPIGWSWNKLYRSQLFKDVRYRDYMLEDIILNAEISKKVKKAVWTNERMYAYRIRTDSETAAGKRDISVPAAESFWKTYEILLYNDSSFTDRYLLAVLGKTANLYGNCRKTHGKKSAGPIQAVYCKKFDMYRNVIKNMSFKDFVKLNMARYVGSLYSYMAK